jgi:Cu/Ag efflux protein CusF/pimeloyl-ACP methyl ester carboxylesterase
MPKPTIYIPGFPASELRDKNTQETLFPPPSLGQAAAIIKRLVDHPEDAEVGPPILDKIKHFAPAASTLYDILKKRGISEANGNFIPIGWDWRKSVADAGTIGDIKKAVDKLSTQGKIVAVVHSTGGLVFRAYLDAHPGDLQKFEQVLAFAVPWRGALESLHAVSEGVPIQLGIEPIVFKTFVSAEQSKDLLTRAQAAYDLFPTDETMKLFFSAGAPSTPLDDRTWLDPNRPYMKDFCDKAFPPFASFDGIPVTSVCGWGGDTWPRCDNDNGQLTFQKPINEAGDGTVPFVSAASLDGDRVRKLFLPIGGFVDDSFPKFHGQIWAPKIAGQIFDEVFDDAQKKPFVAAAVDKDQGIDPEAKKVTVRVAANDIDGAPLPNAKLSFRVGPHTVTQSFNGGKRITLELERGNFEQQAANNIRRTVLTVAWDGASPRKLPISIKTG